MEPFQIVLSFSGNKRYRMTVTQKYENETSERWEVRAKNHTFLIDCNRPEMIRKGEVHFEWKWKLVAGQCPEYFLKEIQQEIRKTLNWMNHMDKG